MKHAFWLATTAIALAASAAALAEEQAAKPDLAKAKQIVDTVCAACHGADGNSPTSANPSLAGQGADYITLQLQHFKSGVRANAIMAGMVAALNPEDMRALGLYFAQQTAKIVGAREHDLALAGQQIYRGGNAATGVPACAACHSPEGAGVPSRYPRLGGQHAEYSLAQLKAFKSGERGMDKGGKDVNGKVMAQVAARLSEHEMQALVQYVSGLH
ncbi:MAG: c-type cytochrome [Casimicrobiaceae bacterium]